MCGLRRQIVAHRAVDRWKGGGELAIDRHLARQCNAVVVNSAGVRDFYVANGLPAEKIHVISNGVPPATPSETSRGQLLAELGLPEGSRLVGVVGGLRQQKRIKDAIWAADLLKVIRDDVHLLVIGDGPHGHRLRLFRDQVVIADKVHFLGPRAMCRACCRTSMPSGRPARCEGQSNAILEAMAAGVPVVATDIPGTRDLVLHGVTGYLAAVGHRAGLVRWTNLLLDDAALRQRLGEAARRRAADEFSVAAMVRGYVELYGEVLQSSQKGTK